MGHTLWGNLFRIVEKLIICFETFIEWHLQNEQKASFLNLALQRLAS